MIEKYHIEIDFHAKGQDLTAYTTAFGFYLNGVPQNAFRFFQVLEETFMVTETRHTNVYWLSGDHESGYTLRSPILNTITDGTGTINTIREMLDHYSCWFQEEDCSRLHLPDGASIQLGEGEASLNENVVSMLAMSLEVLGARTI